MGDTEKLFDKIDEIQKDLAEVKSDVKVLKAKEQPSHPCRQYMSEVKSDIKNSLAHITADNEYRNETMRKDIDAIGSQLHKKVSFGFFWKFVGVTISMIGIIITVVKVFL